MKVLIIDDEIDLCLILKSFFTRKGYDVALAHSITDGLQKAYDIKPDTIFLDNNLPDGTGWEYAPKLAVDLPETAIYLMSAFHPTPPQMPAGAKYKQLEKPISLADLE